MAVLNEEQRKKSATIGKDRYPMPDKEHARLALAFINKGGLSESQKAKVRARAHKMLADGKTVENARKGGK